MLVIAPVSVLLPLAENTPPVLLIPLGVPAPVAAMLMSLASVIPPVRCKALPAVAAPGFRMIWPEPSALEWLTSRMPPASIVVPVRVELSADSSKVPRSFFCRALEAVLKANGALRVSVSPATTSTPTVAAFRLKVRAVENVPAARNPWVPELAESRMTFPAFPNAESAATDRMPPVISTIDPEPPNVLVPASSKVPAPSLPRTTADAPVAPPLRVPVRRRPDGVLDVLAVDTLKTGPEPATRLARVMLSAIRSWY